MTLHNLPFANVDNCPFCEEPHTRVIDTRIISGVKRRTRKCVKCKDKTRTIEVEESELEAFIEHAMAYRAILHDDQALEAWQ